MDKKKLLAFVCCLFVATAAFGQAKTVKLKNGGVVTGTITKIDGGYEVMTKAGVVKVATDQVASIADVVTPDNEYLQRLRKIDRTDPEARYAMAEWAIRKGLLKIAVAELNEALKLKADYERAALLLKQVKAQIASAHHRPPHSLDGAATHPAALRKGFITAKDMNRIRISEVTPDDHVRVEFTNRVVERFIKMMLKTDDFRDNPSSEKRFRKLSSTRKVVYMLNKLDESSVGGNWSMKDDILIKSDPRNFQEFRRRIWPLISNNCASGACHGGPKGKGKLKLFIVKNSDDLGIYTNFLILDMYSKGGVSMLYRDHPEQSLLLEYGLARKEAKRRHPVELSVPIFKNIRDRKYRAVEDWIRSLNGPPHPRYDVKFQPPFGPKQKNLFDPLNIKAPNKNKPKSGATTQPVAQPKKGPVRPI